MLYRLLIVFSFLLLYSSVSYAQEQRLNKKKVPAHVQTYIATYYPTASRIKYYHQVENDTLMIECDFKYNIDKYSLLFLPNGLLYEVEIMVKFDEFPTEIETLIRSELNNRFHKYKIKECYEVNPSTNALYEINVDGATKTHSGSYELFFDKKGNFIKIKENIIQPISTLF